MEKPIPVVSNWRILRNLLVILKNPLIFHREIFDEVGDTFVVNSLNGEDLIITRSSEIALQVLQKNHRNYEKSTLQTVDLAKYIGHGLLTSNGEHWLTHRRMIQPAFGRKKLQGLLSIVFETITKEVDHIEEDKYIDVYPVMSDIAFQVVAKALFSAGDIRDQMNQLQKITQTTQTMLIRELRQPYMRWWFRLSGALDRSLQLADKARSILSELVEQRKSSGIEKDDLLDMLLSAKYDDGTPMSERQLIDEVMILFTAGHETTANALSFVMFHIAKDAEIENGIFKEVINFDFSNDNLGNVFKDLTYTKQCIEEAMRLYPPAYVIDRVAIADDEVRGQKLPGGGMILTSIYELHRDERYWDNPEAFDPDRFDPKTKEERAGHYFPFGVGPRMCVGNHFAMFEMIVAVAQLVIKYKLSTDMENVDINPLVSLKPKKVSIKFNSRSFED